MKPEYAAFVAKVITDFAKSEDTVVLFGYLGPSPEEDRSRVYTDLTLHHHIEISDADILHVEPVSKEDAASGTYIWIKADARVIHRRTEVKASFLEGGIQRRYTQSSYAYDPCCLPPPCPPQSPSPDCPGGSPYPCRSSPTSHSCP